MWLGRTLAKPWQMDGRKGKQDIFGFLPKI